MPFRIHAVFSQSFFNRPFCRAFFARLGPLCLLLGGAVLLSACGERREAAAASPEEPPVVQVSRPLRKQIEIWDAHTARIEGQKAVEIRSRVNGYLEKVLFKDGDHVEVGQVLFEIDPRPFEAAADACKASVAEIEARIALANSNFERAQELYNSNAVSKEVLETRRSELLSSKALLMSAQARLKEALLDLEFTKIRSPITGYVSRRLIDEGNLVNSSTTLLASVVSREVVYAYFDVSEPDVLRYGQAGVFDGVIHSKHEGPPVRLRLRDEAAPTHFGRLTYADNTLTAGSLQLRADIENPAGKLYPGMYGELELRVGQPKDSILVPESAIGTDMVGRFVYLCDEQGNVEYRAVRVGEVVTLDSVKGNLQIVSEGLDGSERVIVSGLQRAMQNKKVTPVEVPIE